MTFLPPQILNERALKDGDILNTRFQKLQQDFENQLISTDTLAQENQARVSELKVRIRGSHRPESPNLRSEYEGHTGPSL